MPAAECREHGFVYSVWTSPELSDTIRFFWILPIGIMLFLFWDKIPKKIQKILLITACVLFGAVYILRMLDTADSIVVFSAGKGSDFFH